MKSCRGALRARAAKRARRIDIGISCRIWSSAIASARAELMDPTMWREVDGERPSRIPVTTQNLTKEMNMKHIVLLCFCTLLAGASTVASAQLQTNSGTGVVKSIDPAAGSITLEHGPVKSLNWPAMTMGFKVKDKKLLDSLKPGDRVQFSVEQSGKDYVVTSIVK